jgi:mevalonate kinase
MDAWHKDLEADHPIRKAIDVTLSHLGFKQSLPVTIQINSNIPISGGLGSGAAVSVSLIRGLSAFLGKELSKQEVSELAFEVEKIHHHTPSGIDNTVVAYEQPVLFHHGEPIQTFQPGGIFTYLIASTGVRTSTGEVVSGVRSRRDESPEKYDRIFDQIDHLVLQAYKGLLAGDVETCGKWMTENHHLLREIGVSSPLLDKLVDALLRAGALGAKLSGAGIGGNVIALIPPEQAEATAAAVKDAGAVETILTRLE